MHATLLMTMPQPSVAVNGGLYALKTTVGVTKLVGDTAWLDGHVSAGGERSLLPTMNEQDLVRPVMSVAVQVIV